MSKNSIASQAIANTRPLRYRFTSKILYEKLHSLCLPKGHKSVSAILGHEAASPLKPFLLLESLAVCCFVRIPICVNR
jgi:hypothetical protein